MSTTLPLLSNCWNSPLLSNIFFFTSDQHIAPFESDSLLEEEIQQPLYNQPGLFHQSMSWEELGIHLHLNSLGRKEPAAWRPLLYMALQVTILVSPREAHCYRQAEFVSGSGQQEQEPPSKRLELTEIGYFFPSHHL